MNIFYDNFMAMGTRFEAVLPGNKNSLAELIFREIRTEVLRLEEKFSHYHPESLVSNINRYARRHPVALDEESWELLFLCLDYGRRTGGLFDITIAPLLSLWGFDKRIRVPEELPAAEDVRNALAKTGLSDLILNETNHTVSFAKPGMKINLAAAAKGYALQKAREILMENGSENALLSFGESSVLGLGHHPFGDSWKIGISHPNDQGAVIYEFSLKDKSLSTSGTYRNFFRINGQIYGHIINPLTGCPVDGIRSVTVSAVSPLEAEILSTALLAGKPSDKLDIQREFPDCEIKEFWNGAAVTG